jgi:hypothetical protein
VVRDVAAVGAALVQEGLEALPSFSRLWSTAPTIDSAMPSTLRALPEKSMSPWTYARASDPSAGLASAWRPLQVRATTSTAGVADSGTRAPSGSTSVIGRSRPP